ncbi:MAG: hypothetical protein OXF26_08645 [Alphaproteobacteria bacterium]|nr:hypothetical protein [Alphaproteobacteria bacterium]MCY4319009.1 hypothetical protein [Alphaproteobacteria bacterium]
MPGGDRGLYSIDQMLTEPAPRLVAVVGMFIARRAPDTADLDEFDDVEF